MTIYTVVCGIEAALQEPCDVTVCERTAFCGLEVLLEGEKFSGELAPELIWIFDGLFVELLVLGKVFQVCLAAALAVESLWDAVTTVSEGQPRD